MGFRSNEEVHPAVILSGVAVFFVALFASVVLYRRLMCGMSWGDSVSFNTHDKRVVRANREYRRNNVEAAPRSATVVRFTIDGQVLSTEDE